MALALAVVLLVGACSEAGLEVSSGSSRDDRRSLPSEDPDVEVPEDLELEALADVEEFWEERYSQIFGGEFEPVAGGFHPYGPDTEIPDCGPQRLDYELAADNAFYCPPDDFIAWDDVGLLADIEAGYGSLAVGVVMAHEYGHAIQARGGGPRTSVVTELQADCYAGAWAADVDGRIEYFSSADGALELAIAGFVELLRDTPGSDPNDPQAHGSAFDRISSFQLGVDEGAEACARYNDDPPVVVQMPFNPNEARTGGNLPTDQLLDLLPLQLESFYETLFEHVDRQWDPLDGIEIIDPRRDRVDCGDETFEDGDLELFSIYCAADDTIYVDGSELLPELEQIGDMAVGGEIARLYAVNAQQQLGISGSVDDLERHADCLTGVFIAAMFNKTIPSQQEPETGLFLSGGDFDEIVIVFLVFSDPSSDVSPIDRVNDFRAGFLQGANACDDFVG